MEGMLHLKVVRSPHAHARITAIRKDKALAVPGVHAVFTWEDVPRRPFTTACHDDFHVDPDDTYMLDNVARFVGQRVAAVVAETEAAAEEGCRLVEVDYEVLPAVFDADEAMLPGAPHFMAARTSTPGSRMPRTTSSRRSRPRPATWPGDLPRRTPSTKARSRCRRSSTRTWKPTARSPGVPPTAASTSAPARRRRTSPRSSSPTCSRCIPQQIHVFSEYVGGGFGGKQELLTEDLCVLAALKTGRPVKWEFTRSEQFTSATSPAIR